MIDDLDNFPENAGREKPRIAKYFWLLCYCVTFVSAFYLSGSQVPKLDLDHSWEVVLEYAFEHHLQYGRDIVFTFGPLGFLNAEHSLGHLIELRTIFAVFWAGIVAWAVIGLTRQISGSLKFVFLAWYLIFSYFGNIELNALIVMTSGCILLMGNIRGHRFAALVCLMVFALLALVKFTFFMAAIVGITLCAGVHCGKRDYRSAGIIIVVFGGIFLAIWLALGQQITNLAPWIRRSMEMTGGYTEAMAQAPDIKVLVLCVAAGCLFWVAIGIITRSARLPLESWGLLTVLVFYTFLIWKHGFVRASEYGVVRFIFGLPLFYAVLLTKSFQEKLSNKCRVSLAVMYLMVILLCSFGSGKNNMLGKFMHWPRHLAYDALNIMRVITGDWRGNFASFRIDKSQWMLPDLPTARRLIGKESVDVLNNNQWAAFANELTYRPRPVIQSYSAYTPILQDLNLSFFRSERRPEWLLYRMEAIDYQYPSLEDATVLPFILNTYRLVTADGGFLVLRNTGRSDTDLNLKLVQEKNMHFGERLDLKPFNSNPLFLQVNMRPTLFGRFVKFFYQLPEVYLSLVSGEKSTDYRFIPAMAKRGFLVSPVIETNDDIIDFLSHKTGNRPDGIKFSIRGNAWGQLSDSFSVKVFQAKGFPIDNLSEK